MPDTTGAARRLKVACVLERFYSFQLESTLASTGFEDCLDELSFIKEVPPTEDAVAHSLTAADRAWGAQHVDVWRRCAESSSPTLVFQDDVAFASPNVLSTTEALVAAAEAAGYGSGDVPTAVIVLDAAAADQAGSGSPLTTADGSTLSSVHSTAQVTAYVLWPRAARVLLDALPLDLPVSAFLGRLIAERKVTALVATPALTA